MKVKTTFILSYKENTLNDMERDIFTVDAACKPYNAYVLYESENEYSLKCHVIGASEKVIEKILKDLKKS